MKPFTVLGLAVSVMVVGCSGSGGGGGGDAYEVSIVRTDFGVPHIEAKDWGSLGFGYGYAHAEDNLCVLMEDIVTIAGNRARFFGRDGNHVIVPNGSVASNVDSDFFWRFMATDEAIAPIRENADPRGRAAIKGFADGFSRYVREIRSGDHAGRHAECRNAEWLREIDDDDMYRRYFRLALIASSSVFVEDIATTQPPLGGGDGDVSPEDLLEALDPEDLPFQNALVSASNMYALGEEAVAEGEQPILFGNPHFPWEETERLYMAHLTIPGEIDIAGVGLYGVPLALIGFNERFAWSHTVSTAFRFTLYELTLAPGDPMSYLYDGELRDIEPVPLEIDVMESDGEITTEQRTLYRSHFGPMIGSLFGLPVLPWNVATAYTLRDANAENERLIEQFFAWNRADDLEGFIDLHASVLGIPWVNTIATGPEGDAYYGDVGVVPNVPDSKVTACPAAVSPIFSQLAPGLPVLDGSRSDCEWDTDEDAPAEGIFGPSNLPTLRRHDWVHNCNDSHWLTNPAEPLTGFAAIIGPEETERTLRTRLCAQQVIERLAGEDGLPGDRFDMDNLQQITLSSRIHSAELALDDTLATLCPLGTVATEEGPVDVTAACDVLADWDRRAQRTSVGAHIWREFWRELEAANLPIWLTSFDAEDPVNTPRDLNVVNPEVQAAFGRAVSRVESVPGIALDTPMGEIQRSGIHDDVIPLFGGESFEGAFTIANARERTADAEGSLTTSRALSEDGYPVTYGNSYIQTVTWEADGAGGFVPRAEGFVTYSQSTDPASPYFQDFTEAYSVQQWHRFPWTRQEIEAQAVERIELREAR